MKKFLTVLLICSTVLCLFGCNSETVESETLGDSTIELSPEVETIMVDGVPYLDLHPLYSYYEDEPDFLKWEYFYLYPKEIRRHQRVYSLYGDFVEFGIEKSSYPKDVKEIPYYFAFYSDKYPEDHPEIHYYIDVGLEKYIDNEWVPVKMRAYSKYGYNSITSGWSFIRLNMIEDGVKKYSMVFDVEETLYEPISSGHYRFIMFLGDASHRYAEFDIE